MAILQIICSLLLTSTIAVPDVKQAFEKYVKDCHQRSFSTRNFALGASGQRKLGKMEITKVATQEPSSQLLKDQDDQVTLSVSYFSH